MNGKDPAREQRERFGSGTPGDQGTYSVVGEQPDGGGAGLGAQVESGTGSAQDIAESQPTPPRSAEEG
jgi:hypothetical protein